MSFHNAFSTCITHHQECKFSKDIWGLVPNMHGEHYGQIWHPADTTYGELNNIQMSPTDAHVSLLALPKNAAVGKPPVLPSGAFQAQAGIPGVGGHLSHHHSGCHHSLFFSRPPSPPIPKPVLPTPCKDPLHHPRGHSRIPAVHSKHQDPPPTPRRRPASQATRGKVSTRLATAQEQSSGHRSAG